MKVTFYGVRGSAPSPSKDTIKYGGNTSCIHIALSDNRSIILDAGTGLRELGKVLCQASGEINLMLSHGHWDHIQGYPFFIPIYQPEREINILSSCHEGVKTIESLINDQMNGFNFPLHANALPCSEQRFVINEVDEFFAPKVEVVSKPLNHPGGGAAYKIIQDGMSVAYVTDNELDPPYKQSTQYHEWVDFLYEVDVLIHDAQYNEQDMPHKHGWGHSLISQVRQLAVDAHVANLVMFHHDPDRTDSELDEIQLENERHLKQYDCLVNSICAAEGMQLHLSRSVLSGSRTKIDITF